MSTVKLERVHKRFGEIVAAHDVSFEVQPGQFLTLLGPSGCGKTTLLRIVAGFLRPSSGLVSLSDQIVNDVPAHLRHVGLVFQSYALFPHMSVRDNVAFGLKMRRVRPADISRRVADTLDLVQLTDRANYFPAQLSGGQQQRVALARALVTEPAVLLLDEPFSALDRKIGETLRTELKRIQRKLSISTILVTHAQDEALLLSDQVAVINHGRIEQIGAPEDIYARPATRFVAEFLGRSNLVSVVSTSDEIRIVGPANDVPRAGQRLATVRPEHVRLMSAGGGCDSSGEYLGTVEDIQFLGHTRIVRIRLDNGASIEALALGGQRADFAVGTCATVAISRSAIHILDVE